MNTFWNTYYNLSQMKRFLLVSGLVYVVSQATIISILHPLGTFTVLQLQTTFSSQQFLEILGQWESAGLMGSYHEHFFFDTAHPVWYSFFISSLLATVFRLKNVNRTYHKYLAIPFIAGICDMIENIFHHWFLADLSRVTSTTVSVTTFFSLVKWVLFIGSFLYVFYQLIRIMINKIRS